MIEVEKMGRPAVPLVSGRFEGDAIASSRAFGMPALQFVIVPRIYRNLSPEESVQNTEPVFDDLIRALTNDNVLNLERDTETATVDCFEGDDRHDAVIKMNDEYLGRDLGDGYPLMSPTRDAVDELMAGTNLSI